MDKCEKCGGKVGKKATFCPVCGEKIEREAKEMPPKGYINIKAFFVGVIVAVFLGCVVAFVLSKNKNSDKASGEVTTDAQKETTDAQKETTTVTDSPKETTGSSENETTQSTEESVEDENNKVDYKIDNYNYIALGDEASRKEKDIYQMYPEIYSISIYKDEYDGLIEGEGEELSMFNHSGIHFVKSEPRDIIDIDYRYDGYAFERVEVYKYNDDFLGRQYIYDVPENACLRPYGNMVVLTKEYLATLEPGYYLFSTVLAGPDGMSCGQMIRVIIHDEPDNNGNYKPEFNAKTQFYSSEKKNDLLFYMNGCLSPIKDVVYEYEVIDKKYYDIICDGYGIVIHSEFFELNENNPYIALILRTESGLKSEVKVVNLKTVP